MIRWLPTRDSARYYGDFSIADDGRRDLQTAPLDKYDLVTITLGQPSEYTANDKLATITINAAGRGGSA
jgi:hypothetical protein